MHYSVIIPTVSGAGKLLEAIQSVVGQTLPPAEIILVVNGSFLDHRIQQVCESHSLNVIFLGTNKGANFARNRGVYESSSEWVAFVDDDDVWLPHKMQRIFDFNDSNSVDAVFHDFYSGRNLSPANVKVSLDASTLSCRNSLGGFSTAIIKRKTFLDVGGADEKFRSCQDWDLWLRISLANYSIVVCPIPLSLHRVHFVSGITKNLDSRYEGLRRMWVKHKFYLEKECVINSLIVLRILVRVRVLKRFLYIKRIGFRNFLLSVVYDAISK